MQAQAFCLYFRLTTLEQYAARLGFTSGDWRELILQDLLHDGKLRGERRLDPKTGDVVHWFFGRKTAVQCCVDHQRADTLFVLGIYPGPEMPQGRIVTGQPVVVPGPWRVATVRPQPMPPPIGVADHLAGIFQVPRRPANANTRRAPPVDPGQTTSPAAPPRSGPALDMPRVRPSQPRGQEVVLASMVRPPLQRPMPVRLPINTRSEVPADTPKPIAAPRTIAPAEPDAPPLTPPEESPHLNGGLSDAVVAAAEPPELRLLAEKAISPVPRSDGEQGLGERWNRWWRRTWIARHPALACIVGEPDPQAARRARIEALEQEIARLRDELAALPSLEVIEEFERAGQQVQALGERSNVVPPDEVVPAPEVVVDLLTMYCARRIDHLPRWALDGHGSAGAWLTTALTDEAAAAQLQGVSEWIRTTFGDAAPESLVDLPCGASEGLPAELLEGAWRAARERESLLAEVAPHARDALAVLPHDVFAAACERVLAWQRLLHSEAMKTMLAGLSAETCAAWLKTTELPPEAQILTGDDLDNVRDLRDFKRALRMIRQVQPIQPVSTAPLPTASLSTAPLSNVARLLGFDHAVTDASGKIIAAALCLPELKPSDEVGMIHLPIRLRASGPFVDPLTLEISAPHLRAMPQTEYVPGGSIVQHENQGVFHWQVKDRPDAWYESDVLGEHYLDTVVPIPVYRQALIGWQRSARAELNLHVHADAHERRLNFTRLLPQPKLATTSEPQATPTELVTKRPLGAQVVYERLAEVIRRGGPSFMVVAPRRFGKTTLLKYLAGSADDQGEVFTVIVDLGRHMTAEDGLVQLFKQIADKLHHVFGAAPAIPTPVAWSQEHFRDIRHFLRTKGRTTLAIFVDEAQVLVPRQNGLAWGNTFKNILEHHLTGQRDSLADVMFGLFGTVDLSVKLGRNCRDFLSTHGHQAHEFEEASLNRYLREVGQGRIESTSAARIELARWANNLWTLDAMLRRILRRINVDQRSFFVTSDVRTAVDELLKDEREDTSGLWGYASAELSYSDEWEPIDAFPLAVAWACHPGSLAPSNALDASAQWLNEQLARLDFPTTITRERLEMCLADLKTRGIIRESGEFRRPLLRELLRRRPAELFNTAINILALSRLAVDIVELPLDVEYQAEGGQAKIFSRRSGDTTLAYRVSRLENSDDRRRFTRMCATIRKIRETRTRQDGDDNLPRIRHAGFRVDNPSEGVLIYDWVQGQSLDTTWPITPARARVHIAWQIARALSALHARSAIHCDVRPGNIIVDGNMNAVLVDFGLVRSYDGHHRTRLADDPFVAPELLQDPPEFSPMADIFSLGVFLRGHDTADSAEWRPLLDRMLSRSARERPGAAEVAAALHNISNRQGFDPRREEAVRQVDTVIEQATDMWLMEVLLPYRNAAALSRCGYLTWDAPRATEVAFYLGNIFAHMLKHCTTAESIALAQLVEGDVSLLSFHGQLTRVHPRPRIAGPWHTQEVRAVGKLRNAWAHQTSRKLLLQEIQGEANRSAGQMLPYYGQCLRAVAKKIDRVSESGDVVEKFVEFFIASATSSEARQTA